MQYWFNEIVDSAIEAIYYDTNLEKAQQSMKNLQKAADEGDADAMYLLARCYGGRDFCWLYFDFPEDDELMSKYMKQSIINGSAAGVLGSMRAGMLTPELEQQMPFSSLKEAWNEIYEKAEAGCVFCQNMIANTYYWLDIVKIDNIDPNSYPNQQIWLKYLGDTMKKSIPWYEKAFKGGMSFAGRNLVVLYEEGEELLVEPEPYKAIEVEKLGASLGYPEWKNRYGVRLIETGEDEKRGVELCLEAAEGGHKIGWYEVAMAYQRGGAYPIDYKKSLEAAEKGIGGNFDIYCCEVASEIYLLGCGGIPKNYERAVYLLERAEKQGSFWAKDKLAFCYVQGLGCNQDVSKAIDILNLLIESEEDSEYINYILGFLNSRGLGLRKNIRKAIKYWKIDEDIFYPSKKALENYKRTWYGRWVEKD